MTFKHAICSFVTLSVSLSCGLQPSAQQTAKASSEKERIARFEKQIEELREKMKIPGLSAAIVKDQKLLWAKGFGLADIENKITKENDRLFMNVVGFPKIEVFPESEDKFFIKAQETRLTFVRDSKGLVTRAEIEDEAEFRGQRMRAPKIK
jgi:hypothetical protein